MNREMAGNAERQILTLPEEVIPAARKMLATMRKVRSKKGDVKVRRDYLYGLDAEKEKNAYYRGICRKYLSFLETAAARTKKKK
jgi:hypothetical protein